MRQEESDRRSFLMRAGGGLAALVGASEVLGFGLEERQLPAGCRWGERRAVAIDSSGWVYVLHAPRRGDALEDIVVFDRAGRFQRSFGSVLDGGGRDILVQVSVERGRAEECLWVCDERGGRVFRMSLEGRALLELSAPTEPAVYGRERAFHPTRVLSHPDGGVWILDGVSLLVHEYDERARWRRTWSTSDARAWQDAHCGGSRRFSRRFQAKSSWTTWP